MVVKFLFLIFREKKIQQQNKSFEIMEEINGEKILIKKTLLKVVIKNKSIIQNITKIVRLISEITIAATLQINYILIKLILFDTKKNINEEMSLMNSNTYFYKYFQCYFDDGVMPSKQYLGMLRKLNVKFEIIGSKNLQELFKIRSIQYHTLVMKNLKLHAFELVKNYLRHVNYKDLKELKKNHKIKLKKAVEKLFLGADKYYMEENYHEFEVDFELYNSRERISTNMEEGLENLELDEEKFGKIPLNIDYGMFRNIWQEGYFKNIYTNPLLYLEDMVKISYYNSEHFLKNVEVFPIAQKKLQNIKFDRENLADLVVGKNIDWKDLLNFPEETSPEHFLGVLETDSYSVSLLFNALNAKKPEEEIQTSPQNFTGIYPSFTRFLTAVRILSPDTSCDKVEKFENIKISGKDFLNKIKLRKRTEILHELTSNYSREIFELKKIYNIKLSGLVSSNYHCKLLDSILFEIKFMNIFQNFYFSKIAIKMEYSGRLLQKQFFNDCINRIVSPYDNAVVFFGATRMAINEDIKNGFIRSPHSLFRTAFQMYPNIKLIDVDDTEAGIHCSKCSIDNLFDNDKNVKNIKKNKNFKYIPKFSICTECKTSWSFDVNAANKILVRGLTDYIKDKSELKNILKSEKPIEISDSD